MLRFQGLDGERSAPLPELLPDLDECLHLPEQEAQGGHILTDRGGSQLLRLEQMSLILPNLLGPELVRWLVKIFRKIADDANVSFCGTMGIVATLEFFQHLFASLGHGDLLF
jgi:hypothetical protein